MKKIYAFFTAYDKETRKAWGPILRQDAIDNFSFARSNKIIEQAIDSLKLLDKNNTWLSPKNLLNPNIQIPQHLSNGEYVDFLIENMIQQPDKLHSEWRNELVKALNIGYLNHKNQRMNFDRKVCYQMFQDKVMQNNFWENQRWLKIVPKENIVEWELV